MTCPGISEFCNAGDKLELDTANWQVRNLTTGQTIAARPLPSFLCEMIELGGEKNYLRARLAREAAQAGLFAPERIEAMAVGLEQVAALPDPVGDIVSQTVRPNGLRIRKVRVPIGKLSHRVQLAAHGQGPFVERIGLVVAAQRFKKGRGQRGGLGHGISLLIWPALVAGSGSHGHSRDRG